MVDPADNNGADVAPAVITRVWSDTSVNVRVLMDDHETPWLTQVRLFESREALEVTGRPGAFWPPRV